MTALEIAARAGKLETVNNMIAIQKEKGMCTEYVEEVVKRMIKSDETSLDMIEELVQHITIQGKINKTKSLKRLDITFITLQILSKW